MKIRDLFLNGQLLREGDENDYYFGKKSIYFNFVLKGNDVVTTVSRGWFRTKRTDWALSLDGHVARWTPFLMDGSVLVPVIDENSPIAVRLVQ